MWQLNPQQRTAALTDDVLAARVFLEQPELGIAGIQWNHQQLTTANLLRVLLRTTQRAPLHDYYVRGTDLVITYGDAPQHKNVRPQLYWRTVAQDEEGRGIELVLSVETDLLHSDPHARVESTIAGNEVLVLTDRGWEPIGGQVTQLRPPHARPLVVVRSEHYSYAEMMFPGDFTSCTIERSGGLCRIMWELFQEDLEKGVIRRARARSMFFNPHDDLNAAQSAFARFENSPLPLTT